MGPTRVRSKRTLLCGKKKKRGKSSVLNFEISNHAEFTVATACLYGGMTTINKEKLFFKYAVFSPFSYWSPWSLTHVPLGS